MQMRQRDAGMRVKMGMLKDGDEKGLFFYLSSSSSSCSSSLFLSFLGSEM